MPIACAVGQLADAGTPTRTGRTRDRGWSAGHLDAMVEVVERPTLARCAVNDHPEPRRNRRQLAELRISGGKLVFPGSDEAIAAGCTCNPDRNNYGFGSLQPNDHIILIVRDDCPIHELVSGPVDPFD